MQLHFSHSHEVLGLVGGKDAGLIPEVVTPCGFTGWMTIINALKGTNHL